MVAWDGDGVLSGFARRPGISADYPGYAGFDLDAMQFASPGSVDAQGTTRLQYTGEPGFEYSEFQSRATLIYDAADVAATAGRFMTATVFIAKDSDITPSGSVPTPNEIRLASTILARPNHDPPTYTGYRNTAGSLTLFTGILASGGAEMLEPGTKYWCLLAPTSVLSGDLVPDIPGDTPIGDINVNGRALSFWTNRSPDAPLITAPLKRSTAFAGADIDFVFVPQDPDRVPRVASDFNKFGFDDMAGVQVQYAPEPTDDDPTPDWSDMPIVNTTGAAVNRGWFIENSASEPANDGAKELWLNYGMKIACGGNDTPPSAGILPSGDWQLRCRVFDYGHPYGGAIPIPGGWFNPLTDTTGSYTPDTYPEFNTSPWSEVVHVSVSEQVPAAIPLSPRDNIAIPEDEPVTLRWQYRNTHVPAFDQAARTVQIRKVGEPDWVTLAASSSEDAFLLVGPVENSLEYMPDLGFEGGTTAGWTVAPGIGYTGTAPTLGALSGLPPQTHQGERALEVTALGNGPVRLSRVFALEPEHDTFSMSGWVRKGPGVGSVTAGVLWRDEDDIVVGSEGGGLVVSPGWVGCYYPNISKPATAVSAELVVETSAPLSSSSDDTRLDDFTFVGVGPSTDSYTLEATTQYEWRVQVTDTDGIVSAFSPVARFWVVSAPVSGPVRPIPSGSIDGATLGCGDYRVFVYRRGGKIRVGELTQVSNLDWNRVRDDISDAKIVVSGWDLDCGNLLRELQTWVYEIVLIRDNGFGPERVWEGPITLLTYAYESVTINAKDVMAYAYRRIIKQAMNDSGSVGGDTVVSRATRVLQNTMAPDDPNVLAYLTPIPQPDDAMQYRSLPPYSRTAFEEVDDMAANAGLDYTTVGRRIMLWGTKHRIGTLTEFRDKDLGAPPIVSEYGMSMANRYVVSDGNGTYGEATRLDVSGNDPVYGLVEMLSSSWASESESEEGTYTEAGLETIRESFAEFAERSIADRYPPPVVVRVPDNTTLNPDTLLSIQQLVPGVVVPLRSTGTLRSVVASQKLDKVQVKVENGKETISVTLSPFSRDDVGEEGGEE